MTFESHWASEHFEPYDPAINGEELASSAAGARSPFARRDVDDLVRQPRRPPVSASAADARSADDRARAPRPPPEPRCRRDGHRQDGRRGARLPAACSRAAGATSRCSSSRIARRSCASRWPRIARCFETARSARSTAAGRIAQGRHVFAMVQSLHRVATRADRPDAFDVVVVDEFHHAAAATYDRLLNHLSRGAPRPHGDPGASRRPGRHRVVRPSHRRRAPALGGDRPGLPCAVPVLRRCRRHRPAPAHLAARRIRAEELSNLLVQRRSPGRASCSRRSRRIVLDPGAMRALGFCVSKEHARYMARKFTEAGLESVALTGDDAPDDRDRYLQRPQAGQAALHLLRRGARRGRRRARRRLPAAAPPDSVRDGVRAAARPRPAASGGQEPPHRHRPDRPAPPRVPLRGSPRAHHRSRRGPVSKQVDSDFPFLPAGCTIDLDRQSREIVLDNLKAAVRRSRWATLVADLRGEPDDDHAGPSSWSAARSPARGRLPRRRSWTELRRDAGRTTAPRRRRGARSDGTESARSADPHRRSRAGRVLPQRARARRSRRARSASTSASGAC